MRLVIQRVTKADLSIENESVASINQGLLVLIGVEKEDNQDDIDWLVTKMLNMRIFADDEGKMNRSVLDIIGGEVLLVSQFTLHASTQKGNRPSFIKAASPDIAKLLYQNFIEKTIQIIGNEKVKTGVFAANMQINLVNDGPVTIIIDSKNKE
jgi:D-tyrosyl-tRNA(Tyr) deacylase